MAGGLGVLEDVEYHTHFSKAQNTAQSCDAAMRITANSAQPEQVQ